MDKGHASGAAGTMEASRIHRFLGERVEEPRVLMGGSAALALF
jgi:hypothetical protein